MNDPSTILFSPPIIRGGQLYRGVAATDRPYITPSRIDRARWVLLLLYHGASVAWPHPEIDIYMTDPCYRERSGSPQVYLTPRDFTDPEEFYPLGLEKPFDVVVNSAWRLLKRPGLMVDALTFARDRGRPIRCLWFGYQWHPEGIELERTILAEIAARGLTVTYERPNFDRREVNRRFNLARAAVLCSATEAGPRIMSEAMLAGLPYITTADTEGGSPGWVNDQNGRVCAPTAEAIARAIWHVLDHADSYRPREWALNNMCKPVALRRLREALALLAERKGWRVNLDLSYSRIDWRSERGDVERADAACRP
jgi:hypothetical protein